MGEETQCLKLSEGTTMAQLLFCTPVTLSLKGTKEQTPLMLCDESRGKAALGKQLVFLQQPGKGDKQINADTRLHLMS